LIAQALALAGQRKFDEEIAVLDKAVAVDPKSVLAIKLRQRALIKRDLAGAIADYNKAMELNPSDARLFVGRGKGAGCAGAVPRRSARAVRVGTARNSGITR